MFQVYKEQCKNCLLSEDSIVSPERRKEIIQECEKEQKYFVCHKASMEDKEIVCNKFYNELGHLSQGIRLAQRLNIIQMVEQTDTERLMSHKEMEGNKG